MLITISDTFIRERRTGRVLGLMFVTAFVATFAAALAVLLALSLFAPHVSAQAPQSSAPVTSASAGDTLTYLYIRANDTIAVEKTIHTAKGIVGLFDLKGQVRIVWTQHIDANNTIAALDMDVFGPGTAASAPPLRQLTLRVVADTGIIDILANAAVTSSDRVGVPAGSKWLLNQSVLHADLLAANAREHAQTIVPIILAQGGQRLPASVSSSGDTTIVSLAGGETRFIHDSQGLKEATGAGGLLVRRVSGATAALASAPPSYAAPANAPYTAEDVVIPTPAGHNIAATLTRPRGNARMPVVITISGSGQQDRNETLSIVRGYAMFRDIADTLGRRGIAVLRWDDEGVGGSGGNPRTATSVDYARDVDALVAWLRRRPDIDGTRIALVGHSEGGMIAPMVAADNPYVRAIALLAGPGYTGQRILRYQFNGSMAVKAGSVTAGRDTADAKSTELIADMAKDNPWTRYFLSYDPLPTARRVVQPVLILQGDTDHQITHEQADTLAAAFRAGGNPDVTMRKFRDVNHLFLTDPDGRGSAYSGISKPGIAPEVLGALANWFSIKLTP